MRASVPILCLLAVAGFVAKVSCLTNREVYELIKEHAEEFVVEDPSAVADDDDNDGTITLPGGENDEVDVAVLLDKMCLLADDEQEDDEQESDKTAVSWRHKHHHHHHHHHHNIHHHHHHHHTRHHHHYHCRRRWTRKCSCNRSGCTCCVRQKYRMNILGLNIRFQIKPCVTFKSSRYWWHGLVTFNVNGRLINRHLMSLRRPTHKCYRQRFGTFCLKVYNGNVHHRSMCANVYGTLTLRFRNIRFNLKLACFRLPRFVEDDMPSDIMEEESMPRDPMDEESMARDTTEEESIPRDPME